MTLHRCAVKRHGMDLAYASRSPGMKGAMSRLVFAVIDPAMICMDPDCLVKNETRVKLAR